MDPLPNLASIWFHIAKVVLRRASSGDNSDSNATVSGEFNKLGRDEGAQGATSTQLGFCVADTESAAAVPFKAEDCDSVNPKVTPDQMKLCTPIPRPCSFRICQ